MNTHGSGLSKYNILLCGLAFTSRTETVEDYLIDKVESLTVVSLTSCFQKENLSSCRIYEKGKFKNEFKLPAFLLKDYKWFRQPLIFLVFISYFLSICFVLFKAKKKFDLYIGISYSFGLWGAIFKKLGIIKRFIYYSIDYYSPTKNFTFNNLFIRFVNSIDRFTVKNADCVWDLSSLIPYLRQELGKIKIGTYNESVVPLGYSKRLRRFKEFDKINRWEIGFVGSVSENQGLQLLVEAMPEVISRFPKVKAKIIGQGPYLSQLKSEVLSKGLEYYFEFLGFIKEEEKMLDILSACAIGIALYSLLENQNIVCADAGKPKLYALLGLPIITTKAYILSNELSNNKVGLSIDYKKEDLVNAVSYLLEDDKRLIDFRVNAYNFSNQFICDRIFDEAFNKMGMV